MLSGEFAESEPRDFSEPIGEGEQAEDYVYYSDSDLEDDGDEVNAGKAHEKPPLGGNSSHPLRSPTINKELAPTTESGKKLWGEAQLSGDRQPHVKVHDIAVITCVSRNRGHHIANAFADFRPFRRICTLVISNSHHMDRRRIGGQGVPRSCLRQRIRYLDHHQSQYIDSWTRYS